jgi:hypothetical protein
MFAPGTSQWSFSEDVNIGINFCVWILQLDGLRVSPFDAHPAGDGSLQGVGLHPQMWRSWFIETVIGQRSPANPSLAMIGTPAFRQRLQTSWSQYLPAVNAWRKSWISKHLIPGAISGRSLEESRQLWDDLVPFHSKLASFRIYYVDYPQVVSEVIPPASLVLGSGHDAQSASHYREHILRAAETLSHNT